MNEQMNELYKKGPGAGEKQKKVRHVAGDTTTLVFFLENFVCFLLYIMEILKYKKNGPVNLHHPVSS